MNRELDKLYLAALESLQYVESANYPERERHARAELRRNFEALDEGRFDEIGFRYERDSTT